MATTLLKIEELINGADMLRNLTVPELVEESIQNGEGVLTKDGALSVSTGTFTGRSPKDKFVVQDEVSNNLVDWGNVNQPIAEEKFSALLDKVLDHLEKKDKRVRKNDSTFPHVCHRGEVFFITVPKQRVRGTSTVHIIPLL